MTKRIHVTDLREITAVTITCIECGAAFRLPVARPFRVEHCPACNTRLALDAVYALAETVRALNAPAKPAVRVSFETDEPA